MMNAKRLLSNPKGTSSSLNSCRLLGLTKKKCKKAKKTKRKIKRMMKKRRK